MAHLLLLKFVRGAVHGDVIVLGGPSRVVDVHGHVGGGSVQLLGHVTQVVGVAVRGRLRPQRRRSVVVGHSHVTRMPILSDELTRQDLTG